MASESALRQRIAGLLREHGFFVQSIESAINPGMPDMYYRLNKQVVGWLELKHVTEIPKRASTSLFKSMNHPLSSEQENWIHAELRRAGRADILVSYERQYFLVPGTLAPVFNDLTFPLLSEFAVDKKHIPHKLKLQDFHE